MNSLKIQCFCKNLKKAPVAVSKILHVKPLHIQSVSKYNIAGCLTLTTLKLVSLGTKFQVFRCYVESLDKTLRFVTHVGPNTIYQQIYVTYL